MLEVDLSKGKFRFSKKRNNSLMENASLRNPGPSDDLESLKKNTIPRELPCYCKNQVLVYHKMVITGFSALFRFKTKISTN